jgi:hypothetical protein
VTRPYIVPRVLVVVVGLVVVLAQMVAPMFEGRAFGEGVDAAAIGISVAVAVVMAVIVWFAFRPPVAQRAAFRGAPVALGVLVSARPTGMSINDQPEMELVVEIEAPDGRTVRGTAKEVVDLGTLAQLVPGATVPVAYLPDGRMAVAPHASDESMEDAMYAARLAQGRLTPRQVEVARRGVKARAVIMSMRPTGEIRGDETVVHLDLRVTRPDGTTFDATRELPVPQIALAGLQTGAIVEARYLPDDEAYVAVSTRVR